LCLICNGKIDYALFDEIWIEINESNLEQWTNEETILVLLKVVVLAIKGKIEKKIKTMHECCLFVVIIIYVEIWRMNWEEIEILCLICNEKIDYVLNYEHCNLVGDYRIFM
jgi:hypothetical protein